MNWEGLTLSAGLSSVLHFDPLAGGSFTRTLGMFLFAVRESEMQAR
jgi:hypothetical protein